MKPLTEGGYVCHSSGHKERHWTNNTSIFIWQEEPQGAGTMPPERPGAKMSTSSSLMRRSLTLSTHLTLDKTNTVITCLDTRQHEPAISFYHLVLVDLSNRCILCPIGIL